MNASTTIAPIVSRDDRGRSLVCRTSGMMVLPALALEKSAASAANHRLENFVNLVQRLLAHPLRHPVIDVAQRLRVLGVKRVFTHGTHEARTIRLEETGVVPLSGEVCC